MRVTAFLMIIGLLHISLAGECQTISFSGRDVPLKEVFAIIKKQTGVVFFYDADLLENAKPVTIEWKELSLETALNEIFKGQHLTWLLEDKTITVIKKPGPVTNNPQLSSQRSPLIPVKGIITTTNGIPISGVSVLISDSKQGTISDDKGRFFLEARPNNLLVFSSVNYITKEVKVEKAEMSIILQLQVKPLEALLVGGNFFVKTRKEIATSITVLDSKTLERIPENTLDQIFRGWVPGTNNFNVGDAPEGFPVLSIRGAGGVNSLSTIAVYIDGIEYAGGSGYLSQLDKTNIDRIEIVRGPGAATMYGTGSNAGIVQIFTKKTPPGETGVNFTTSAGFYKSKWVKEDPFQQMHTIESITGFKNGSLKLGGSYRTVNAYLPDGGEKNKGFYADARFNSGKLQADLTGRYNARDFHLSRDPHYDTALHPRKDIIIEPFAGFKTPAYLWFNVRPTPSRYKDGITETFISGINLTHRTNENWTNHLDAGYTINNSGELPGPERANPLQRQYFSDKNNITTIRYSNVLNFYSVTGFAAVILSGAEYKRYSYSRRITRATAATTNTLLLKDPDNENFGAFVQVNPSYKNVYLTLGLRGEKNELFKASWNPRMGLTTNFDTKSLTFKPRISWGKGITSPTYQQRFGRAQNIATVIYAAPEIKPQSQEGFDYGLEVYDKKGAYKFELIYYNNMLKDMIGREVLGPVSGGDSGVVGFIHTNVGKVANSGWEFSGEYRIGRFHLQGTFSLMNSIIKDSTGSYVFPQLKLPPGSRMVNLPRHTAGFNLTYNFLKLFGRNDKGAVSINVTEVSGVKNIDFRNYALDVSYGRTAYVPGTFGYPTENSLVFRVGLYADYHLSKDFRFFAQGSNILNDYNYEYSPEYPTHGATWLFGIKFNYSKNK